MTQQKHKKKAWCCGCFDWLFARRAHRSPSEEPDYNVEETKNAGAQDDAGQQALVCLKNAAQPLAVVEEELPSDTLQDADGVVGNGGKGAIGKSPQTLIITIHLVKREKVHKPVDEEDRTQMVSHGKRPQTLVITLPMVKRDNIQEVYDELPSEHQGTAGDAPSSRCKAVTWPPEKMPLNSSFKQQDASQTPVRKIVRLNFQNLNTFFKIRELYCGYDYFKYGFPLSSIRSELPKLKERRVKAQDEPPKEAVNKLPEPQKTVTEEATVSNNKNTEPHHLTGILKKGKTASTAHKCVRFNFQNLNTFVKDRELYCGYDYFKYGFPLSSIRSELPKLKERTVKPQEEPPKEAVNKLPEPQKTVTEEATVSNNKNTEPHHLTGILKKGKTASTAHKCVRFNFQNLNTFVKDRELYCGYDYFKYGFPLSSIRSELQKPKERTVKPQDKPPKEAVHRHNARYQQTVRAAGCTPLNTTTGGKSPKGILKKEKMPRSTCPKHVPFNLGNLRAPVKERELYRGHEYFRYAAPPKPLHLPTLPRGLTTSPLDPPLTRCVAHLGTSGGRHSGATTPSSKAVAGMLHTTTPTAATHSTASTTPAATSRPDTKQGISMEGRHIQAPTPTAEVVSREAPSRVMVIFCKHRASTQSRDQTQMFSDVQLTYIPGALLNTR
ncbi:uncharacterized protein LOC127008881 isoform X2 [Eriocheir sinensis]|uniref:uncharacterized protein LOC127008881 isoform X2 n=1 Tax=Eriocheir sinensis TaxID=95602 RepID=UPI0021CA6D4A|nr:uncharacterized protein LOC127008881 isoform X2 [Eriocheir sinensis]